MAIILTRTARFVKQTEDLYKEAAGTSNNTGAGGSTSIPTLQQVVDKEGIVDATGIIFKNAALDEVKLYLDVDGNLRIEGSLVAESNVTGWANGASQPTTVWDALGSHVDDVTIEYVGGELKLKSGGGATTFDALTDTPSTKVASKWVRVNSGGTALEYVDAPVTATPNLQAVTTEGASTTLAISTPRVIGTGLDNISIPSIDDAFFDGYGIKMNRTTGYITNYDATGNLRFGVGGHHNANVKMYINYLGEVGIGTVAPDERLDVRGNTVIQNGAAGYLNVYESATSFTKLFPYGLVVNRSAAYFANSFVDGDIYIQTENGTGFKTRYHIDGGANGHTWYGHDGTAIMKINTATGHGTFSLYTSDGVSKGVDLQANGNSYFNGGNVGIGDTTPTEGRLVIGSQTGVSTIYMGRAAGYASIKSNEWLIMDSTTNPVALNYYVANDIILAYGGGNVGIGTTSPNDILDIHKANSQLRLTDTDDSKFCQFSYSGGSLAIRSNKISGTDHFWLTETGRVGIGTSTPDALLNVEGSSGELIRLTYGSLQAGFIRAVKNGVNNWYVGNGSSSSDDMYVTNYRSNSNLYLSTGGSTGMMFDGTNHRIGVGTTTPAVPFHMSKGNTSALIKLTSNIDAGLILEADADNVTETHNPYINFIQDGGAIKANIGLNDTGLDSVQNIVAGALTNSLMFHSTSGTYAMQFATNANTRMTIKADGKVGIGTNSPTTLLDVRGVLRLGATNAAHLQENTTNTYGNLYLTGTNRGGYFGMTTAGYNQATLMDHATASSWGLYSQAGSEWALLATRNGGVNLRYNNVVKIQTYSAGVQINGATGTTYALEVSGTVNATDFRATSDKRKKKSVSFIRDADSILSALNGVRYNWRKQFSDDRSKKLGFIAQDVEKIVPEAVRIDSDGYYGLDYNSFAPILVEGWKSHDDEIKKHKHTIKHQQIMIDNLTYRLDGLERSLDGITK